MRYLVARELVNDQFKITLKEPIPLYLEGHYPQCLASHEGSRVYGQGKDFSSAVSNFGDSFISVYLSYCATEEPLSAGAEQYADYLGRLVENIEKIHHVEEIEEGKK